MIELTRHAALGAAAGQLAGRLALSARVVALSEGATKAMTLIPLKAAAGLLSVGLVAAGATALAQKAYGPGAGTSTHPDSGLTERLVTAPTPTSAKVASSPEILAANVPPPMATDEPPLLPEPPGTSPFDLDPPPPVAGPRPAPAPSPSPFEADRAIPAPAGAALQPPSADLPTTGIPIAAEQEAPPVMPTEMPAKTVAPVADPIEPRARVREHELCGDSAIPSVRSDQVAQ